MNTALNPFGTSDMVMVAELISSQLQEEVGRIIKTRAKPRPRRAFIFRPPGRA
jgi:hypothetical protein